MCASVNRNEIYEDGRRQLFKKQQEYWRRQLCALEICEEEWEIFLITLTQNIVDTMKTKWRFSIYGQNCVLTENSSRSRPNVEEIQGRKVKEKGNQNTLKLRQHCEENEYVHKPLSWLGYISNYEVHGILKWVMQDYSDACMELAKGTITMMDVSKSEINDYRCMIMEKALQKGTKCLLLICHFNEIKE
jgi:hypothetical protein